MRRVPAATFDAVTGTLRIQVTDTGPGISPDQFHLLFAPFERLGAEQTSVPGTGVGLALSRGLAEAMGGKLDVESTPGRGSTFRVEFPIVESPVRIFEEATQRYIVLVHKYADLLGPEEAKRRLSEKGDELSSFCLPCAGVLAEEARKF